MAGRDIVAIAYSEFDKILGPQLKMWYPQNSFRRETFDSLSQYVIMDKEYCERIVMVEIEEWNLLSWSSTVENPKYFRNSVTFSFSFILDKKVDVQIYGKALKKIANTFVHMEIEQDFLTNMDTRAELPLIFKQLYDGLTSFSSSAIFCHTSPSTKARTFFNVGLYRSPDMAAPLLADHQVPILIHSHVDLSKLPGDVSIPHLIMHIDGVSHIKKLAREVDMDVINVKKCLLLLQHHKVVIMSDMFKFSNIYKLVSDQSIDLLSIPEVEQEMMMLVVNPTYLPLHMRDPAASGAALAQPTVATATSAAQIPSYALLCSAVLSLITDLHPAHTLAQIVLKQKQKFSDNIFQYYDLVRLLAYLQHKQVVTRINEHPVYMGEVDLPALVSSDAQAPAPESEGQRFVKLSRKSTTIKSAAGVHPHPHHHVHSAAGAPLDSEAVFNQVIRRLDGSESLDYICCKFELNHLDVMNHPDVSIIYK